MTSIGASAFAYGSGLTSVEIPNSVTSIEIFAFGGCTELTSVEIGNSVTSIGAEAFYDCYGLTSVNLPASVTTIGENAFMGVNWIKEIRAEGYIPASVPETAFSTSAYRTATLMVPKGSLANYKAHPTWSKFVNIEEDDNEQTGIDEVTVKDAPSVRVDGGAVVIEDAKNVRIFTAEGNAVYFGGAGRVELAPGIYLVVTDNRTTKIVVR